MKFIKILLTCSFVLIFTSIVSLASLNQGLVAYFPFNGNAQDESEYQNNSIVNEATLAQDRFGNENSSYYFNGLNSYIEIPDCNHLQFENIATLCLWVKIPENTNTNDVIISKYKSDTPDEDGYGIMLDTESNLKTMIKPGNNATFDNLKASFENYETWTFLCMVIRNDQKLLFYIDGEKVYESENLLQSFVGSTQSLLLGAAHYYNGQISPYSYYKGYIDDIRIYNRPLSEAEINDLYSLANEHSCNIVDSDNDGIIDNWDKCPNTLNDKFVDNEGCQLQGIFTQNELNQAIAEAITEKNQIIIQKENIIDELNSTILNMFTEEQLNNAIVKAILEKQQKIEELETQISQMFTTNQVNEAILNAKKGLYNQEQVDTIINKLLEWDANNDGTIGLIEAIHALQKVTDVIPIQ